MTLNQTIQRLQSLALAHSQVKSFFFGDPVEWLANKEMVYPVICIDWPSGVISPNVFQTRLTFDVWVMDLVNISENARGNELELMSDLLLIAEDYAAEIQSTKFQDDWAVSDHFPMQFFKEKFEDLTVAIKFTIDIATDYPSNRCQVPTSNASLFIEGQ